ncbi:MAG: hypothetical protein K5839_01935 [Treponemataceae bacterium]|nr:hypothetical protein [Treponemataceae bacterium]
MIELFSSTVLADNLTPIIASSPLWKGKDLHVFIIANPHSGGFTQPKVAHDNLTILRAASANAKDMEQQVKSIDVKSYDTEYACHSMEFVEKLFKVSIPLLEEGESSSHRVLFITAGGDGTSLEVQSILLRLSRASEQYKNIIQKCCCLLRLPFGTGNDGSDGRTLEEALLRLTFPKKIELQKAVEVSIQGKTGGFYGEWNANKKDNVLPPWYAFNIASIGIDAFITHMTNKMKDKLPGDFYKLWVDLACLFYNIPYKQGNCHVDIYKDEKQVGTYDGTVEFVVMGESGHRTYGSNHKILPDDNTVCITHGMTLLGKLATKESFNIGTHAGKDYSEMYDADKLVINYDKNILVQLDGESHLLTKENFPIVMKHTEPVIPIIRI